MDPGAPQIDLGRELGAGTTGSVRHGRLRAPFGDLPAGGEVAVKRVAAGAPTAAGKALAREAEVLVDVRGVAHLAQLLHAGEDHGGPYLVTRFLAGRTLRERLADGPVPEPEARRLGAQVAGALAALHAAGWWHGDVKPENVRLDGRGDAHLIDLGFARRVDGSEAGSPGSLPYLAPEACAGRIGGPASDVFALGVLLAELTTGKVPCAPDEAERASPDAWLHARLSASDYLASAVNPNLSPLLDALLGEALAADPASRPTAEEVAARLREGEAGSWWRDVVAQGPRPRPAPSDLALLPFAGRAAELARLHEIHAAAARGPGGVLWIEGEEGAGKSRLMAEFVAAARHGGTPPLYLDGRCSEFPDERPGQPLRALLRRWLHLPRRRPIGPRERALLAEVATAPIIEVLERALDPDAAESPAGEGEALAEALARLGRDRPVVVFLDDVTFADHVTLDGLARLVDRLDRTRVLLVLGLRWGRPATHPVGLENFRARAATRVHTDEILLGPLSEDDLLELVRRLFRSSVPQLRLARVLHERSGGSPELLVELLRTLRARGDVRSARGELDLLIPPDEVPEPGSVPRLVEERYRGLDARQRAWLPRLAALGEHLSPVFLSRAFPELSRAEARRLLDDLREEGWLVEGEDQARFARSQHRAHLYRLLSEEERAATPAAAARALRGESGRDRQHQRAYHLHHAGEHEALLEVAVPLVRRLRERGHPARVSTLTGWGLAALDALPSTPEGERARVELLEAAADAADRLGRLADQRAALDRLTDLDLDPDRDPEAVGRVYLLHGRHATSTGQYGAARGMLRNAALLFRQAGAPAQESEALLRLAHVQGHVGELEEARSLARSAQDLATDEAQSARCELALAAAALVADELEEALRRIEAATVRLRHADDPTGGRGAAAEAMLLRARAYRLAGRPRRAMRAIQRAARLAARAGERRLEAEVAARHGRLLLDLDRSADAELVLREALLRCQEIEYHPGRALATAFLGTLLAEEGQPGAEEMLARNTELARDLGLARVEALCLALRARLARQAGRQEEALELSRLAYERFEHSGGELADRIVVHATRALLLAEAGEEAAAREVEGVLRRRVRRVNERIQATILRQRHRRASTSLLRAALSPEGPVYPRAALEGLPGAAAEG